MYLCEIMNELSVIKSTPHMRLVYTLDIIILNACSMAIVYACLWKLDGLWAMLICNFTVLVLLRQYLFKLLQIHWLSSPLNRCLKRLTDIVCALVFLTTLFPIILFAYFYLLQSHLPKKIHPQTEMGQCYILPHHFPESTFRSSARPPSQKEQQRL